LLALFFLYRPFSLPKSVLSYDTYQSPFVNPEKFIFVSRLAKDRLFVEIGQQEHPFIFEDYSIPMVSRNGKLMMCINGFKDAVVNHKETILKFLWQ